MTSLMELLTTGNSVYGITALSDYMSGRVCCAIHKTVEEVVGDAVVGIEGQAGTHPALRVASLRGYRGCLAERSTLELDRQFAVGAVTFSLTGFQFRSKKILSHLRKYETGTVMGLESFGRGYCYLGLFREAMRFRVARVLGPVPFVSDVALLYRLAGRDVHRYTVRSVSQGFFHCERSDEVIDGKDMFALLLGLVEMWPDARIGSGGFSWVNCSRCGKYVQPIAHVCRPDTAGKSKVWCDRCCCFVVGEDHEKRCRPKISRDVGRELVGDALHGLDVKMGLVYSLLPGMQLTEVAKEFVSASAQRNYLQSVEPGLLPEGCSDRQWSNLFESKYDGVFRDKYLDWFSAELEEQYGRSIARSDYFRRGLPDHGWIQCLLVKSSEWLSFIHDWIGWVE